MLDLKIKTDNNQLDIDYQDGELQSDDIRRTAILNSLFTDASVTQGEASVANLEKYDGWLGGDYGSKLWLLSRAKISEETRGLFDFYLRDALNFTEVNDLEIVQEARSICANIILEVDRNG